MYNFIVYVNNFSPPEFYFFYARFLKLTNCPVKSYVAIETLESNQSHYMIFVFTGE
jgi:hypothetical protein